MAVAVKRYPLNTYRRYRCHPGRDGVRQREAQAGLHAAFDGLAIAPRRLESPLPYAAEGGRLEEP